MTPVSWRYRGAVTSRAIAAIGGGYLLTSIASALLALAFGSTLPRADAVTIATLLSFVIYTCAILWVFATTSATRAWRGIAIVCALLGAVQWLAGRAA